MRSHNIAIVLLLSMAPFARSQQGTTDQLISSYQARLSRSPNESSSYDKLGAAYLQKGRETSDLTYYELAEKSLTRSLELTSFMDMSAAAPLTHLAAVCMAEHRFSDAADYAERALRDVVPGAG